MISFRIEILFKFFLWETNLKPPLSFSILQIRRMNRFNKPYSRKTCCWNCKAEGHIASECDKEKRIFCSYCLREGVTTRSCRCNNSQPSTSTYVQVNHPVPSNSLLKYPECPVSRHVSHSPLKISVGDEAFEGFINTLNLQTEVGWMVAVKASIIFGSRREFSRSAEAITSEILVPLNIGGKTRTLRCLVKDSPDIIMLGLDALRCFGSSLKISDLVCLDIKGCPDVNHQTCSDIPRIGEVTLAIPKKTSSVERIKPKNPIDLTLPENPEPTLEPGSKAHLSWEELMLTEPVNEFEKAAIDYVMSLNESEIDDYLQLDADESEVAKMEN